MAGDANTQSYENIKRYIHRHNKAGDANTQSYENVRGTVIAIICQKTQIRRFKGHLISTTESECENAAFLLCYAT